MKYFTQQKNFKLLNQSKINFKQYLVLIIFFTIIQIYSAKAQATIGGINFGNLTNYFMVFSDGNVDANWQGASKGFVGNIAINGIKADERTSGTVPYAGTIYTNDTTLGAWKKIINDNSTQSSGSYSQVSLISELVNNLESCFSQINSLTVTSGYSSVSASSLNGLNTQNGTTEIYIINITSGFSVSSKINITGDASDVFIFRWDTDANFSNGYDGQVKFQSGGAFVPLGGLLACNFIHVAGDIASSGGGSNPSSPFPQGPRFNNGIGGLINDGSDFNGGGFFTGYWLTTGSPTITPGGGVQPYGKTGSLSNAIFVGGWYSKTTEFSMTSGTSGVYVTPQTALPVTWLNINANKNENGSIKIKWATASEVNNDFFTVQKSIDSRNFIDIAKVKGSGNKASVTNYYYEDKTNTLGTVYYRIKQTDFNGDYDFSSVVAINLETNLKNVNFYPNPATISTTISWDINLKEDLILQITTITGEVIKNETINVSGNFYSLNIESLKNGLYLINMYSKNEIIFKGKLLISK